MPASDRSRDRGLRQARRIAYEFGRELRDARMAAGLSQGDVGRAARVSQSRMSRIEHASSAPANIDELSLLCSTLGLRLSLKAYPAGSPVRDAAQLRLEERFRPRVAPAFRWRTEVPIGGDGDLRAWDVQLDGPGSIGIDAETRLYDIQAVQRRCELKQPDSHVERIVLLVARTHHNTAILRAHRAALASTFPADTFETMAALTRGRLPERNGIVVI